MRGLSLGLLLALAMSATASAQATEPHELVGATITTSIAVFGGFTCHHVGPGILVVTTEEVGTVGGTDYLIPGFTIRKGGANGEHIANSTPLGGRSEAVVTTVEGTYCIVLLTPVPTNVIHLMRVEARHYPAS